MDKEDKMRKTITKVVLIICAVSVALGIALCASGVVMGADVEKALRGIGINVETRIEPNNMYDDYNDDINDFFKEFGIGHIEASNDFIEGIDAEVTVTLLDIG